MARYEERRGNRTEAHRLLQKAIAEVSAKTPDDPYLGHLLMTLGFFRMHNDVRNVAAPPLAASQHFERVFSPDHREVGNALGVLAWVESEMSSSQRERMVAADHFRRGIDITEKTLGKDHSRTKLFKKHFSLLQKKLPFGCA